MFLTEFTSPYSCHNNFSISLTPSSVNSEDMDETSAGLEGKGISTKSHTQHCRSPSDDVRSLGRDECVSGAVSRATALWEERNVWVSKWRMRERYGFMYFTSAVAVCCACSRVTGGLPAKERLLVHFSSTDDWQWKWSVVFSLQGREIQTPQRSYQGLSIARIHWETLVHVNLVESWGMKNQLDVTCYFISLIMRSTCVGH